MAVLLWLHQGKEGWPYSPCHHDLGDMAVLLQIMIAFGKRRLRWGPYSPCCHHCCYGSVSMRATGYVVTLSGMNYVLSKVPINNSTQNKGNSRTVLLVLPQWKIAKARSHPLSLDPLSTALHSHTQPYTAMHSHAQPWTPNYLLYRILWHVNITLACDSLP